jgi:ParB family chromosome partitioning protein
MADIPAASAENNTAKKAEASVPIEKVFANPDQPRRTFDANALEDLTNSIKEKGIIQPLIVRRQPNGDGYEIVAGERRWRAAQKANLHAVPVVVRDFTDTEVLEVAIIENIQRADLNPIDEASGYRQLMDRFGHTQEQVASALSKSRSYIANHLRLLSLPDDVAGWLRDGSLTAGHARALVGHPDASGLARLIIQKNLSVRETEKLVKRGDVEPKKRSVAPRAKDADTVQIERDLTATIGMPVSIQHQATGNGGKLSVSYKDLEQLDDLLRILSGT